MSITQYMTCEYPEYHGPIPQRTRIWHYLRKVTCPTLSMPRGHFYNTLQQFDWGRFRALAEESQLSEQPPRLFLQQFQLPGVYVFYLSSNRHRKMVSV